MTIEIIFKPLKISFMKIRNINISLFYLLNFQKNTLFLFLFFNSFFTISQISNQKEIIEASYTDYFNMERETIHLHINKNIFLNGEPIWFKGYVFDKKNSQPFINTTNVYVSLLDSEGNEVITKLFFAQNGTFAGNLDINSNLKPGKYKLRAYTNWMNNFEEDESFVSGFIDIINKNSESQSIESNTSSDHDLQFLPEGGHLISNVTNTIGFKSINCYGEGVNTEGFITNSKNEQVAVFKSNPFGLGKFDLELLENETYTANYTIDNILYKKALPKSEPEGFALSVINYTNPNTTFVSLKTNQFTLDKENGKTYYLAINQNNKISVVNIDINTLKTNNTIPIPNKNLISGVNTITLFDNNNNPLLERLIFNYDTSFFLKSNIYATKSSQDSIPINIKISGHNNETKAAQLSIAILPEESLANNQREEIITSFLIKPYINGNIENPNYYFIDEDRLRKYDLDLLLLTQGWSKYSWENIKKGSQKFEHGFDSGLSIKGIANIPKGTNQNYSVQMFSFTNQLNEIAPFDENNNFFFNNYFLKDEALINFTILKNGEKMGNIKPYVEIIDNKRKLLNKSFQLPTFCNTNSQTDRVYEFSNSITENEQVLDTVRLSHIKIKKPEKLTYEKSYIANSYSKGIKIDSISKRYYNYVTDMINANGFVVDQLQGTGIVRIKNRNPISFKSSNEPLLIIDDTSYDHNYDILYNMTLDEVDEIYIDQSGNGYGSRGGAGVIRIYKTKGSTNKASYQNKSANEFVIKDGFSVEKEFYIPEFYLHSKNDFLNYGMIHWKSNIATDESGLATYKIFNTNINNATIIIQGISADGKLLSEVKKINLLN